MRKKGQAEIFGLIIIVLLLLFALLFFIKIRQEDTSSVTLRSNFRVNNLLNAILKATVVDSNGREVPMKELLRKCLEDANDNCNDEEEELRGIFEKTLMQTEKYEFKGFIANNADPKIDLHERGNCEEGISASPYNFPGYNFRLNLCYS